MKFDRQQKKVMVRKVKSQSCSQPSLNQLRPKFIFSKQSKDRLKSPKVRVTSNDRKKEYLNRLLNPVLKSPKSSKIRGRNILMTRVSPRQTSNQRSNTSRAFSNVAQSNNRNWRAPSTRYQPPKDDNVCSDDLDQSQELPIADAHFNITRATFLPDTSHNTTWGSNGGMMTGRGRGKRVQETTLLHSFLTNNSNQTKTSKESVDSPGMVNMFSNRAQFAR